MHEVAEETNLPMIKQQISPTVLRQNKIDHGISQQLIKLNDMSGMQRQVQDEIKKTNVKEMI